MPVKELFMGILVSVYRKKLLYFLSTQINGTQTEIRRVLHGFNEQHMPVSEKQLWRLCFSIPERRIRTKLYEYFIECDIDKKAEKSYEIRDDISSSLMQCSQEFIHLVERIFNLRGNFNSAYEMRMLANERLIRKYDNVKKVPDRYFMEMFWALNCESCIEKQKVLCSNMIRIFHREDYIPTAVMNYLYMTGRIHKHRIELIQSNNLEFYKMIVNKKIAIVGPASGHIALEELRKEFDIIVTMNYKGDWSSSPDIVYYPQDVVNQIMMENNGVCHAERLFESYFSVFDSAQLSNDQLKLVKAGRARKEWRNGMNLFANGYASMIPFIVFDIMCFEPKNIKVFNTNFYLSKQKYQMKYLGAVADQNNKMEGSKFYVGASGHNFYEQFQLTKDLFNHNCVEFDEMGLEAIEVELEDYCNVLMSVGGI